MSCNSKCACNRKSTIDANFVASQALAINDVFNFPNVTKTGISVISNGSGSFTLNNSGLYLIIANVSGSGDAAGNIAIQLNKNGALIPGTVQVANCTAATDIEQLSTGCIVDVPHSCSCIDNTAIITLVNSGIAATYTNGNIQIIKLA